MRAYNKTPNCKAKPPQLGFRLRWGRYTVKVAMYYYLSLQRKRRRFKSSLTL